MAGAYAAIANDGLYIEPTFYTKVVDSKGDIVLEANPRKTQIMSQEAAYVVKEILTQPVKTGTSTNCTIEGMSVGAKTGTTNNDYDRWFCGFTPYYTAAVWYGYDRTSHVELEPRSFHETKPENVLEVEVCKKSGFLASRYCRRYGTSYTEFFVKGTEPVQTCPYHSYAKVCRESGLLANENCPSTRSVSGRGEYIDSSGLWQTRSSYYKPKNIPTKVCTIH